MPWLLVDDKIRNHPKVLAAGPLAGWQCILGLGYASEYLTDGFIPRAALRALVPNQPPKTTLRLAGVLVQVGLWEERDGGYQIHDDLDYQPTAARVRALQEGGAVESGVQLFDVKRGESPGMRYLRFERWLEEVGARAEFLVSEGLSSGHAARGAITFA